METKTLWKSRTFWLAVLQALAGAVVIFATKYPDVGALVIVKSVLDIAVRYITSEPVSLS